jgi:hypothetical protein
MMRKRIITLLAVLLSFTLTVAVAPTALAAPVSVAAPAAAATPATPASAAYTNLWTLKYGNGYRSTNVTVPSNRNPAWVVGNATVRMTFQIDCNLVIYKPSVSWASNTSHAARPCVLYFQTDGNMAIRQNGGAVVFASGNWHSGFTFFMQAILWSNGCLGLYISTDTLNWYLDWKSC